MHKQLPLILPDRRTPARQKPVVERLLEIVARKGVGTARDAYKGRVMFRPGLKRPQAAYTDLCSNLECLNRQTGLYTYGYGNAAEAKRAGAGAAA
jgi:hypothetical protein